MRWGFLWTLLVVLVVSRPAMTHEPLEESRRRTVVPASRLDAMVRSLQKLARAVVIDLNDDVNAVSLQAETLQRQRWLQAENQSAGFGMPRWPQEQFDAVLERATAAAADVWERYRQRLTWVEVTFGPDGTSVTPPSRSFECLVGRSEALVVQINNQTRQGLNVDVSGQAGDTPIRASQTFVPPNSTECACVLVTVAAPGPLEVRLQCSAGALNTAVQCSGLARPSCRLTIQLVDAATGKPTAARAFVRTEDGRYFVHDDRTVYLAGGKNIQKFGYEDSQFVAVVPPGPVQIKLQRGFEYELTERTEVVGADKTITMALTRWVDMPALGWFSGDTHEHWVTTEWYENGDPDWLNVHTKAEDLWVNNNLILKHWWKGVKSAEFPDGLVALRPDNLPIGRVDRYSTDGRIVWTAEEYRNDEVFGHMVFLRINRLIEPVSTGFMGGPTAVHYPPNSETYDLVRAAGGISIAAHDVAMEVPLQVLLGKLDSLDAYGTNRYYDLLNCGFRLPLSVGSDYPANLMGFARVYVYCGDGLDYSKWVDNLAAGRTFVSSGAMLVLEVDGQPIGSTIALEPGQPARGCCQGLGPLPNSATTRRNRPQRSGDPHGPPATAIARHPVRRDRDDRRSGLAGSPYAGGIPDDLVGTR